MVNGHAVGAGLSLALACDIRIASDRAKFGTVFRNVGFSGDFGGSYFLQRLVGNERARLLYFTGQILEAAEAAAHRHGQQGRARTTTSSKRRWRSPRSSPAAPLSPTLA